MDDELALMKDGLNGSSIPLGQAFDKFAWCSDDSAFRPYTRSDNSSNESCSVVRKSLVAKLTRDIVETFQLCDPRFKYSEELNPKRYLTSPSLGVLNDGFDNVNSDLILAANDILVNSECNLRYIVKDVLGHGTFGQVAKCWAPERNSYVAVKIIKNQPAYYQQALVEVSILRMLNKNFDRDDEYHIVRIYDYFVHRHHLCISFELLDTNLYELIKLNKFRGLSLNVVQLFSKQILSALGLMRDAGIIHCDLKPENILLCTSIKPAEIKVIDFGSACMENRTVYSYIQSRYYRSPEVVLGYHYTAAIDMWSFGCIVAELFLGLPLFPGASEFDLLRRMTKILGGQPPDHVLKDAKNTSKYFKCIGTVHFSGKGIPPMNGRSAFQVLKQEEYESREMKRPVMGKEYFRDMDLNSIVSNYPYSKNMPEEDVAKESRTRLALIDFLRGLVEFDPAKRWSPFQASKHPFITGEPFTYPYRPPAEPPHTPASPSMKVNHHPGGGHWFAAGLSPNVMGPSHDVQHGFSHFQIVRHANPSSYGSLGSCGGYDDATTLRNSISSYGDNNAFSYFSPVAPSGINFHVQNGISMLGNSPEARHRFFQHSNRNGLGVSPSSGNFTHMPLGSSPSQFTPPVHNHFSSPPVHYGPTSPARGNSYGSPLGKMAASTQFNRQKGSYSGSSQWHETSSFPRRHGNFFHDTCSRKTEGGGSWHPQFNSSGSILQHRFDKTSTSYSPMTQTRSYGYGPNSQFQKVVSAAHENPEAIESLPDPGDWDPNYSDELLLQDDDCSELNSLSSDFSKQMCLSQTMQLGDKLNGVASYGSAATSSNIRTSGSFQEFSHAETGPVPSVDVDSRFTRQAQRHTQQFVPPHMQYSLSRLGQQPVQQLNPCNPGASYLGEWRQVANPGGPQSPKGNTLSNGFPWGAKYNHPGSRIPPASHGRKIT